MIAALVAFCALLPVDDQAGCLALLPPPTELACFSVTNYWPFNDAGELQPFNGQADGDPFHTALMIPVTRELEWQLAAVPAPLLGRTIVLSDGREMYGGDTFGAAAYRAGVFWHYSYEEWVIGVDVFTPEPLHYLDCGGYVR